MSAVHTAAILLRAAADDDDDDLALLDGHLPSDAGRFETSGITTAAMAPAAASLPALIPAPASEPGVGDLPARYQAACRALAEAKNVDEVLQIRDRVEAIRACARIAENRQLEIDAAEIRHRAERKLGELIILQKQTVGLNAGAIGTPGPGRGHTGPQENAVTDADRVLKPTLTDAGISKNLSSQAQKLARMSPDEFEQRVENWRENLGTRVTVGLLDTAHVRGTLGTGENDWHTPAVHLDAARRVMGAIDLDPATSDTAQTRVGAAKFYTQKDNGLVQPWSGRVWLNPPYSQPLIRHFVEKMVQCWQKREISAAIMLTHNYTDTGWFHHALSAATAVCFTKGRIRFLDPDGQQAAPTQGQAFFYFGPDGARFAQVFGEFGAVCLPRINGIVL
jgi:phage N-6-adenine-methyltransferase